MITKKIKKGMDDRFIKLFFGRYISEHGHGIRNLKDFKILITSGQCFEDEMPDIVEVEKDTKRYLLIDILKELMARGYIESSANNIEYWMTEKGYLYASINWFQRILMHFNKNAGWAVIIAVISLIISVLVAIFK